MSSQINKESAVDVTVRILLQVGDPVMEISRAQVITQIWEREGSMFAGMKDLYLGKKIDELRNGTIISHCITGIEDAFANGKNSYVEYVSYSNDNRPVFTCSLRVLACHPDKDFVFLVIENITRGNEQQLIDDKWRMALDASGHGVWDVNMATGAIFFSEKWEEIFGYKSQEIKTIDEWESKLHPDDRQATEDKMQAYFSGKSRIYSAEMRYRCKDGSYKWLLSKGITITKNEDGTPLRFVGTHVDLTHLKAVEEELRQARETFANSFEYSGTGKALIAPGGKWLEVNNIICQLTGYTKEELKQLHYKDITYADDREIDTELIKQLVSKEIPSYSIEKRYVSKDRRIITTLLTVTLVWDNEDKPKYFICDIVDISRKRELGDELKRKNQQLETTSANLLGKINQLEEMNNIIAHNLRGPAGNIKMLSDGSGLFSDEEAIGMIHTSSISLLDNLNMLVEVARIKLDKEVEFEKCNFDELIKGITGQLQGIIYQLQVKLELNFEVATVSYPKLYMESILYNLVSNALKYSRKDIQPVIQISTKNIDGRVMLIAKDNGIGIDMKQYGDKVFKLNQVFHKGYDSKGVGLFITKTQIEALGGSIAVKSAPNMGCEFTILL